MTATAKSNDSGIGDKAVRLIGSIRFWGVVLGTIVGGFGEVGAISEGMVKVIIAGIATVVGLGTADKIAETLASRKPPAH